MTKKTLYIVLHKNRVFLNVFSLWLIESMATEAAGAEGRLYKKSKEPTFPTHNHINRQACPNWN